MVLLEHMFGLHNGRTNPTLCSTLAALTSQWAPNNYCALVLSSLLALLAVSGGHVGRKILHTNIVSMTRCPFIDTVWSKTIGKTLSCALTAFQLAGTGFMDALLLVLPYPTWLNSDSGILIKAPWVWSKSLTLCTVRLGEPSHNSEQLLSSHRKWFESNIFLHDTDVCDLGFCAKSIILQDEKRWLIISLCPLSSLWGRVWKNVLRWSRGFSKFFLELQTLKLRWTEGTLWRSKGGDGICFHCKCSLTDGIGSLSPERFHRTWPSGWQWSLHGGRLQLYIRSWGSNPQGSAKSCHLTPESPDYFVSTSHVTFLWSLYTFRVHQNFIAHSLAINLLLMFNSSPIYLLLILL